MLAYDFPILGIFWTMMMLFVWVAFLLVLFHIVVDIFRSGDLGGVGKVFWFLFVIVLPLIGALAYVLVRGDSMKDRQLEQQREQKEHLDNYVRNLAGTSGSGMATELSKLNDLQQQGVLTSEEFATGKARLLG